MTKLLYVDVETTGLSYVSDGIHQVAAHLYINGKRKDALVMDIHPFATDTIDSKALAMSGKTPKDIFSDTHIPPMDAYQRLVTLILRYIDRNNPQDRLFLVGYNNATFDNLFLQRFFVKNRDRHFFRYFWPDTLDVRILATQYLLKQRPAMENFKLATVAGYLGIRVDRQKLHEADFDLWLTRQVHLTGCPPPKSQPTQEEAFAA